MGSTFPSHSARTINTSLIETRRGSIMNHWKSSGKSLLRWRKIRSTAIWSAESRGGRSMQRLVVPLLLSLVEENRGRSFGFRPSSSHVHACLPSLHSFNFLPPTLYQQHLIEPKPHPNSNHPICQSIRYNIISPSDLPIQHCSRLAFSLGHSVTHHSYFTFSTRHVNRQSRDSRNTIHKYVVCCPQNSRMSK